MSGWKTNWGVCSQVSKLVQSLNGSFPLKMAPSHSPQRHRARQNSPPADCWLISQEVPSKPSWIQDLQTLRSYCCRPATCLLREASWLTLAVGLLVALPYTGEPCDWSPWAASFFWGITQKKSYSPSCNCLSLPGISGALLSLFGIELIFFFPGLFSFLGHIKVRSSLPPYPGHPISSPICPIKSSCCFSW